jgi:GT2 family glycosyltransferase
MAGPMSGNTGALAHPTVTVVVVAHSVRSELERCFAALARHAGVSHQTILVDNASNDGTRAWVEEAHPEIKVIGLTENAFGAARNHALPKAEGRYTLFLDSDALLTPGALPALAGALDEHPGWGLVGPRLEYDDGRLQLSCRRYPPLALPLLRRPPLDRFFEDGMTVRRHLMADEPHDRPLKVLYMISACHLFRTDVARAIGPLDPELAYGWEDADWCIRIREAGAEVVYFPAATVVHSYRRMTRRSPVSRAALRQLRCHVHFQRKYWPRRHELRSFREEPV